MSLVEPEVPDDFDQFWEGVRDEASRVRLQFHRDPVGGSRSNTHAIDRIEFEGMGGALLKGWFSYPLNAAHAPAFLWIPPYGRQSVLPNEYGTREGFASLTFNFFGYDGFYQEPYRVDRGYFAEGASSPETFVFKGMIQNCIIALRVLEAQLEVDEQRLGCMGMSQGGGLAIATAANTKKAKVVCADMPFLGGAMHTLSATVHRYPLKELSDFMESTPLGRERLAHTLSYYDTIHHATRCAQPTQVRLGLKDPACRPDSVRSIYNALPGEKALIEIDWGHDWHPSMIESNLDWLQTHLH